MARMRSISRSTKVAVSKVNRMNVPGSKFKDIAGYAELQKLFFQLMNDVPEQYKELLVKAGAMIERDIKGSIRSITGNLLRSVRTRRTFTLKTNRVSVMMGGKGAAHAHLVEFGHRQISPSGEVTGTVPGKHMMRDAFNRNADKIAAEAEEILNKVLR